MSSNRSTGPGPLVWIVVGVFTIFGLLPALARGGGGTFTLLVVAIILWVGWRVMRASVRAGDVARPDAARRTWPPPASDPEPAERAALDEPSPTAGPAPAPADAVVEAPDEEPDIAALRARLEELEALRAGGAIDAAEYEARRAEAFRES